MGPDSTFPCQVTLGRALTFGSLTRQRWWILSQELGIPNTKPQGKDTNSPLSSAGLESSFVNEVRLC